MKNSKSALIYTRISTNQKKQKNSLQIQIDTCRYFAESNGYSIAGEYCEEMSGRISDRPKLKEAINRATKEDHFIIVMKVDRLSRDHKCYSVIEPVMNKLRFVSFGDTTVDPFVFSILLAVSVNEANLISMRVKMSLQKLKKQGRKLGSKNMPELYAKGLKVRKENALAYAKTAKPIIDDFISLGYTTNKELCSKLNECTFRTRTGKPFTEQNLYRLRKYIQRNL